MYQTCHTDGERFVFNRRSDQQCVAWVDLGRPPPPHQDGRASVRAFLRQYEEYVAEFKERAQKLVASRSITTEVVHQAHLKFYVDADYLESAIELVLIKEVTSVDDLTSGTLSFFLEIKAKESKDNVDLSLLDSIVESELRMDMSDESARWRVENLFISYHTILRRDGLDSIVSTNQKETVHHVLSAIQLSSLPVRLSYNLKLPNTDLKKDFRDSCNMLSSCPKRYNLSIQALQGLATQRTSDCLAARVDPPTPSLLIPARRQTTRTGSVQRRNHLSPCLLHAAPKV